MAEGVQVEALNSKYFCHHCTREVSPFCAAELICPDCSSSFLEEVSKDLYEAENIPQSDDFDCDVDGDADAEDPDSDDLSLFSNFQMDNLLSQMLLNVAENEPLEPEEPDDFSRDSVYEDLFRHVREGIGIESNPYIERLSYIEGYRYDAEMDAIASQLLDEIEVSGPPPLAKDQIKSLPVIVLKEEHIKNGAQCTICMDDLVVREKVKSLPCKHLYHEKCITPWLERQATCPNCREVIEIQPKNKRARSCPRTSRGHVATSNETNRRFSEAPSLSDFFTTSMNPFRFLH